MRDNAPVPISAPKSRALLAMLLVEAGRAVSVDKLVAALWGDEPPDQAQAVLQVHVSNLRKSLGGPDVVVTQRPGYRIDVTSDQLDLLQFDRLVAAAHDHRAHGALPRAESNLEAALALWTGDALGDIDQTPVVAAGRTWLAERRVNAVEEHADVLLALGHGSDVVTELEPLIADYPLRESLWERMIRALYSAGRQADALGAYRRARQLLLDEVGVEPGPALRELELAVLTQSLDPSGSAKAASARPVSVFEQYETTKVATSRVGWLRTSEGATHPIDKPITIGRNRDNVVTLTDPSVSRQHAVIRPVMGGCLLVDLSSSNGTRVRGVQVMQQLLADGDVIEFGNCVATYYTADSADGGFGEP
jgi:DNA-binding SARP family transcriptional activator